MAEGSWFVYRSPYEGPSGRRVRRLPDASPLAWFQRMWQTTADEESFEREADAYDWVDANLEADLGGRVYGLNSVFCTLADADPASLWADRRDPLPASTWQELEGLLRRYLYVEGDPSDQIRIGQRARRDRRRRGRPRLLLPRRRPGRIRPGRVRAARGLAATDGPRHGRPRLRRAGRGPAADRRPWRDGDDLRGRPQAGRPLRSAEPGPTFGPGRRPAARAGLLPPFGAAAPTPAGPTP